MDKKCECCGKLIVNAHHKQKYCKPCARKVEKNRHKHHDIMRKRKIVAERKKKIDTTQCRTCLYRFDPYHGFSGWGCGYCYFNGHKRPCEPSPNCTVCEIYTDEAQSALLEAVEALISKENEEANKESGDEYDLG